MISLLLTCLALLAGTAGPAPHGLKITIRYDSANPDGLRFESTEYVQQDRKRFEYKNQGGPRTAMITRCDLGRIYELNLDDHHYHWSPLPPYPTIDDWRVAAQKASSRPPVKRSPTRLIETRTVDTGERRTMFGHVARHVITTTTETWLRNGGDEAQRSEIASQEHAGTYVSFQSYHSDSTTVTDGWYIDLDTSFACDPFWQSMLTGNVSVVSYGSLADSSSVDVPAFKTIGKPETGRALQTNTTVRSTLTLPDGTRHEHVSTFDVQVTELTEGPLDPALFEPPAAFHHDWTVSLQATVNYTWERLTASVARLFY